MSSCHQNLSLYKVKIYNVYKPCGRMKKKLKSGYPAGYVKIKSKINYEILLYVFI